MYSNSKTKNRHKCQLILPLAFMLTILGTNSAMAEFKGSVEFVSDYIWRGVSQTGGDPSVQGTIEWDSNFGLYAGIWGSNVNFEVPGEEDAVERATLELDLYAGIGIQLADDLGFRAQVTRYTFSGLGATARANSEFEEIYAEVNIPLVSVWGATSENYLATGNYAAYYGAQIDIPIPIIGFHVGLELIQSEDPLDSFEVGGNTVEVKEYQVARVGVDYNLFGLSLGINYYTTDLDARSNLCTNGELIRCKDTTVFSLSRNF